MTQLSEVARLTLENVPLDPDVRDAFTLWTSVMRDCTAGRTEMRAGRYVYRRSLLSHVMRLWPELDSDEYPDKCKLLYGILRNMDVARCVHRKDPPVWYVNPTWPSSEGKETPQVTTRTLSPHAARLRDERIARRQLLVEFIDGLTQPVTQSELAHQFEVHTTTMGQDLRALVEAGSLFSRQETTEERTLRFARQVRSAASALYSTRNPVPPRTEREVVLGYVAEYGTVTKTPEPAPAPAVEDTFNPADRVRQIIAENAYLREQVASLHAQVAEANETISRLSKPSLPADVQKALSEWSPSI